MTKRREGSQSLEMKLNISNKNKHFHLLDYQIYDFYNIRTQPV